MSNPSEYEILPDQEIFNPKDEIGDARRNMLDAVAEHPEHAWRAFDLKTYALRAGDDHGAYGLGLVELIEEDVLEQHPDDHLIRPGKNYEPLVNL